MHITRFSLHLLPETSARPALTQPVCMQHVAGCLSALFCGLTCISDHLQSSDTLALSASSWTEQSRNHKGWLLKADISNQETHIQSSTHWYTHTHTQQSRNSDEHRYQHTPLNTPTQAIRTYIYTHIYSHGRRQMHNKNTQYTLVQVQITPPTTRQNL